MKVFAIKARLRGDWIALAGAVLAAAAIYAVLIHPSLASLAATDKARAARDAAAGDLMEARRQHHSLLSLIADQKRQLQGLGGSPPSLNDKEARLARIATLAREAGLAIDQYSPSGEVELADYSAVYVQFTARGTFPQVREFFRRVESEVDYADITHFTLVATVDSARPVESLCVTNWSCKLSGMPRKSPGPGTPAPPANVGRVEVAFHEP